MTLRCASRKLTSCHEALSSGAIACQLGFVALRVLAGADLNLSWSPRLPAVRHGGLLHHFVMNCDQVTGVKILTDQLAEVRRSSHAWLTAPTGTMVAETRFAVCCLPKRRS